MTVSSTATFVRLAGNGSANSITTTFPVFDEDDLVVTSIDANGIPSVLTLTTDYSVAIDSITYLATVTLVSTPATGITVDVRSSTVLSQPASFRNLGRYMPEIHEEAFDRVERQIQDTARQVGNALRFPDNEATGATLLPSVSERKAKTLVFDATTGQPIAGTPTTQILDITQIGMYGTDSGAVNAYVITVTSSVALTLTTGVVVRFKATTTNTGASTANVSGLGVKSIVNGMGDALTGGEISSLGYTWIQYNGTAWQIIANGNIGTFNPRTDAEIAESAVPAFYTIPSHKALSEVLLYRYLTDAELAGTGDVTDKINWAIQVAKTSGCYDLKLPAASLNVSAELPVDASGMSISGPGPERCVITQTAANTSCFTTPTSINRLLWVKMAGFKVIMPETSTGHGIHIRNPESFKGEWLRVTTVTANPTAGKGIFIERESDTDYGYYACIEHSHVDKMYDGVVVQGVNPGGANGHWLERVISNNNANYGFHIKNNSGTYLKFCAGEQNLHNVYIEDGFGVQVLHGRFERPDTHNIYCSSNGEAHLIQGNLLASAGYVNTATGRGVYLDGTNQAVQVCNNTFQEGFSSYDVEVVAGELNAIMLDNVCKTVASGWDVGGIRVSDAGTRTIRRDLVMTASNAYESHPTDIRVATGKLVIGDAQARLYAGTGTPEGAVAAEVGSVYMRENGGGGFTFYVKESGTGNTGWSDVA